MHTVMITILILLIGVPVTVFSRLPFVGRFVSTERRENTAAFAAATGFEDVHVKNRIFNEFRDKGNGDFLYMFSIEHMDYKQELPFRMGMQHEAAYNGTSFTYKFFEETNQLKFDSAVLPNGRRVTHTYTFDPHGYVKQYKVNDTVACKVWFKRHP